MTTSIGAAAAWHSRQTVTLAVTAVILGLGLTGCGSSGSLLGDSTTTAAPAIVQAPPPAPVELGRLALAAPIGAPDAVAQRLIEQMTAALTARNVKVVKSGEASDYSLRGYVVAAKEKTSTKVSYIYDVTDPSGRRVNRFTGEEVVPGAAAGDAWSATTPQLTQTIVDKTASQIAAWLPSQKASGAVAQANPPSAVGAPPPVQTASNPAAPVQTASAPASAAAQQRVAVVPSVTGAPGDGNQALTGALARELARSGVAPASGDPNAYRVEGKVAMSTPQGGKQSITIDWQVKDGRGKKLGSVSQKNEIQEGSLNGPWGQTADAAAAAAAQGIVKLLPQSKTATN